MKNTEKIDYNNINYVEPNQKTSGEFEETVISTTHELDYLFKKLSTSEEVWKYFKNTSRVHKKKSLEKKYIDVLNAMELGFDLPLLSIMHNLHEKGNMIKKHSLVSHLKKLISFEKIIKIKYGTYRKIC